MQPYLKVQLRVSTVNLQMKGMMEMVECKISHLLLKEFLSPSPLILKLIFQRPSVVTLKRSFSSVNDNIFVLSNPALFLRGFSGEYSLLSSHFFLLSNSVLYNNYFCLLHLAFTF